MSKTMLAIVVAAAFAAAGAAPAAADIEPLPSAACNDGTRNAHQSDLRSQDALDAARSLPLDQLVAVSEGLRSTSQDLRSQDALDAARSLPSDQLVAVSKGLRSTAPQPTSVRVRQSDGFDWPSAVMGAAGLLGLIGVSLAVLLGVRQIRRRPRWLTDSLLLSTHADGEGRASVWGSSSPRGSHLSHAPIPITGSAKARPPIGSSSAEPAPRAHRARRPPCATAAAASRSLPQPTSVSHRNDT